MSARSEGEQRKALATATVVTLAAAGGVSALFFAFTSTTGEAAASEPSVVTEYVDQQGNPIDFTALTTQPNVIYVDEQGELLANGPTPASTDAEVAAAAPMAAEASTSVREQGYEEDEYEENEHQENAYEEGDHEEGEHDDD